jgi:pimeloyl-ACP methyl ester carboxylesterase
MSSADHKLAPPGRKALIGEIRVLFDLARMVKPLVGARLRGRREQRPLLVIMAPGFGSDDRYLAPLRAFLGRHGYQAEGYGLGRNLAGINLPHQFEDLSERWGFAPRPDYRGEASVPFLCDRFIDQIDARHAETGLPVALVGWSLGGYLCREAARDLPDIVRSVVTLGAPAVGGPKYTSAAPFFRRRGMDLDWIEAEIAKREKRPIKQPITVVYSKTDGIVDWHACIDQHSPNACHVEVATGHLGMGFNPSVWRHVLEALEATPA